ncbi:hypothetical protein [Flavobacterium sp. SORGH_AS_0622]|uniref:hypothetical protein n=1 Tax=Flavobacterium sp. SORGH_AS_0622 TaxID=3041772 RepID=UPI00277F1F46|nr:hypothetical protein [Flavobacterium sp. SORGH_AS_0622]MDQ1166208.1 hypothetical protein [Flavobacterium sp. SORGH_AS_0622]
MEKQHNHDYGQFDPDYIDQNTLVDGTYSVEDEYKQELKKHDEREFGESDPDIIEQNTLIDNDNYARDEDPYQYQEEFVEDLSHPEQDFEKNTNVRSENIPNQERIINEDDAITNDDTEDDLNDEYDPDLDLDNDLEKDDNDEELDDFDAEHYPENHPRE